MSFNNGNSPLCSCICDNSRYRYIKSVNHIDIVRLLLSVPSINVNECIRRNNIESKSILGSPLYIAIWTNNIDVVKLLLSVPSINVNLGGVIDFHFLFDRILLWTASLCCLQKTFYRYCETSSHQSKR